MKYLLLIALIVSFSNGFSQPIPRVVQGHNFNLNSAAISDDGKTIISAAGDKKMILWDKDLKKELRIVTEKSSIFNNVSISPSGTYFGAVTQGQFLIWTKNKDQPILKLKSKDPYKNICTFGQIISESEALVVIDNRLKIVNFLTKEIISETNDLEFLPIKVWFDTERKIISTFRIEDQSILMYSKNDLELIRSIKTGMNEVISLSIHPKVDKLIVSGNSAKARELNFNGELLSEISHEEALNLPNCFYFDESIFGISYNKLFEWKNEKCTVTEFPFESILPTQPNSKGLIPIGNWDFSIGVLDFGTTNTYLSFEVEMTHCEGLEAVEGGFVFKGRDGIIRHLNFDNILQPSIYDFNRNDSYENVQTMGNLKTFFIDDKSIFSSNEKEAYLISKQSNEVLKKFNIDYQILSMSGEGGVIYDVSSNYDGSIINKTSLSSKERSQLINLKDKSITQLKVDKSGNIIAMVSGSSWTEGGILLINSAGKILDSIQIGKRPVTDIKYFKEQDLLFYATGGFNQKVIGINMQTRKEIYNSSGRVIAYDPINKVVAYYKNQTGEKFASIQVQTLEGKMVSTFEAHSSIISHLEFSVDSRYLISSSWDKALKIWDWKNSKLLMTAYFNSESENFHLLSSESYYYTSKENVDDIFFVQNGEISLFEQYDTYLNRPDKVLSAFKESDPSFIELFYKSHQKRLERLGLSDQNANYFNTLAEAPRINYTYDNSDQVLFEGNFENLIIKQNGVSLKKSQLSKGNKDQSCEVNLLPEDNHFEIFKIDDKGLKSKSYYTSIYNANQNESNLYLITLAVSEFKDSNFNLSYASKDAKDIQSHFESNWAKGKVNQLTLLNDDFNKEKLREMTQFLKTSTENDVVMVFISSHGVLDANYEYYLATYDMNFQKPSENGVSIQYLENLLTSSSSKRKVVFIDACHSGEIDKSEIQLAETLATESEDVSFRGFQKFSSTSTLSAFQVSKELFTDLSSESGISFISSAAGVEFALEGDEWKNGVFTYVLLEGLQNKTADFDADGVILLSELEKCLTLRVPILTGGAQQPNARIKNPFLNFVIQEKK